MCECPEPRAWMSRPASSASAISRAAAAIASHSSVATRSIRCETCARYWRPKRISSLVMSAFRPDVCCGGVSSGIPGEVKCAVSGITRRSLLSDDVTESDERIIEFWAQFFSESAADCQRRRESATRCTPGCARRRGQFCKRRIEDAPRERISRARRRYDHRCELRDVVHCAWVGVDADVGGVEFAKGIASLPAKLGGGATAVGCSQSRSDAGSTDPERASFVADEIAGAANEGCDAASCAGHTRHTRADCHHYTPRALERSGMGGHAVITDEDAGTAGGLGDTCRELCARGRVLGHGREAQHCDIRWWCTSGPPRGYDRITRCCDGVGSAPAHSGCFAGRAGRVAYAHRRLTSVNGEHILRHIGHDGTCARLSVAWLSVTSARSWYLSPR